MIKENQPVHGRIQRGGDKRSGPPLKNHKTRGLHSITGPDPLKKQASIQSWVTIDQHLVVFGSPLSPHRLE